MRNQVMYTMNTQCTKCILCQWFKFAKTPLSVHVYIVMYNQQYTPKSILCVQQEAFPVTLVYSIHVQNGIEVTYCCTLTGAHLNPVESTVAIPVFDV